MHKKTKLDTIKSLIFAHMTCSRRSVQSIKNYASKGKRNNNTTKMITRNSNRFKIDKSTINNTKLILRNISTISNS